MISISSVKFIMGLFKKLFKRKKGNKSKVAETSRQTTKVEEREEEQPVTRSNTPEHPEQQNYNESNLPSDYRTDRPAVDKLHQPRVPPSAREAAFHGPPRFGWVDIVRITFLRDNMIQSCTYDELLTFPMVTCRKPWLPSRFKPPIDDLRS